MIIEHMLAMAAKSQRINQVMKSARRVLHLSITIFKACRRRQICSLTCKREIRYFWHVLPTSHKYSSTGRIHRRPWRRIHSMGVAACTVKEQHREEEEEQGITGWRMNLWTFVESQKARRPNCGLTSTLWPHPTFPIRPIDRRKATRGE